MGFLSFLVKRGLLASFCKRGVFAGFSPLTSASLTLSRMSTRRQAARASNPTGASRSTASQYSALRFLSTRKRRPKLIFAWHLSTSTLCLSESASQ